MRLDIRETLSTVYQLMTDPVEFIAGKATNINYQSAKVKTIEVSTIVFKAAVSEACEVALTPLKIVGAPIKLILMATSFFMNKCGKKVDLTQYSYTFKDFAEFKKSMLKVSLYAAVVLIGYYSLPAVCGFLAVKMTPAKSVNLNNMKMIPGTHFQLEISPAQKRRWSMQNSQTIRLAQVQS